MTRFYVSGHLANVYLLFTSFIDLFFNPPPLIKIFWSVKPNRNYSFFTFHWRLCTTVWTAKCLLFLQHSVRWALNKPKTQTQKPCTLSSIHCMCRTDLVTGSDLLSELSTTASLLISFDQTLMSLWSLSVETTPKGINNFGDGGGDKWCLDGTLSETVQINSSSLDIISLASLHST